MISLKTYTVNQEVDCQWRPIEAIAINRKGFLSV